MIFIGVPVILAGMIGGPTRPAQSLRHAMAPYLRERPGLAFGAMGLLLIILFAWGPIPATRSWLGILIIIALAMFATQMLRREAALEFPDAQMSSQWLQERMDSIRHRFAGAQSSLRAEAHATRQRWHPNGPPQDRADEGVALDTAQVPRPVSATAPLPHPPAETAAAVAQDLPGQLQRLAALHTAGALTSEEYAAAKQRLISGAG